MKTIEKITLSEDVTLISLNDSPADIKLIAEIFNMTAQAGIDVDMISQTPPSGLHSSLSFTVNDEDFGKVLETVDELRHLNPELKISVSSGNAKIALLGESMRNQPGIAAKVFGAVASVNTDIRMITTSETDISLLVAKVDVENAVAAIKKVFD